MILASKHLEWVQEATKSMWVSPWREGAPGGVLGMQSQGLDGHSRWAGWGLRTGVQKLRAALLDSTLILHKTPRRHSGNSPCPFSSPLLAPVFASTWNAFSSPVHPASFCTSFKTQLSLHLGFLLTSPGGIKHNILCALRTCTVFSCGTWHILFCVLLIA